MNDRWMTTVIATWIVVPAILLSVTDRVRATGMVPQTSVLIVDEHDEEASMTLTNTDVQPALLVTSVEGIGQDSERLLLVSPPVVRVEAGKKQRVRFLLTSPTPLKTERLHRVIFRGIPPRDGDGRQIRVSVTQNLPVIIRPAGLPKDPAPWKRLVWKRDGNALLVFNASPYVIRLGQDIATIPAGDGFTLPHAYILPGERIRLSAADGVNVQKVKQVRLSPGSTWGYAQDAYEAEVLD